MLPLNSRIQSGWDDSTCATPESNLVDSRQIALGNVEGKLFWSLIAQTFHQ